MTQPPIPVVPGSGPPQPYPLHPAPLPPTSRRASPLSIAFLVTGSLMFLIGLGAYAGSGGGQTPAGASSPSPVPVIVYVPAEPTTTPGAPATTGPPPPPPAPTIEDGTWTVGLDFPAGRYRTTANVSSTCYWGIYKSGTNGEVIIANDIPGGGRPTVTLKNGQDFATQRCGTWAKVG